MLALTDAIKLRNVRAFIWALRFGEGTQGDDGFQTLFGGRLFAGKDGKVHTFDDFADHPRLKVTVRLKTGKTLTSTAAGAGQFLERTWDGLVAQYHFADFSPTNQELAMVALIQGRKALADVVTGQWRSAVAKCALEWASLPGSPYGQPVVTLEQFGQQYHKAGGLDYPEDQLSIIEQQTGQTAPQLPELPVIPVDHPLARIASIAVQTAPPTLTQETPMLPALAAAFLPSIIQLVPQLVKIFGSGTEVSNRNAAAVDAVFSVAKDAIGAKNEQEVIDTIQSDPQAAATVKDAIEKSFLQIAEAGGGGIDGARDYSIKVASLVDTAGHPVPLSKQPAFIISCILLFMVLLVVVEVLFPWELFTDKEIFSSEVRLIVVTALITGVLSSVVAFWLGSTFNSKQKDNTISAIGSRATDRS